MRGLAVAAVLAGALALAAPAVAAPPIKHVFVIVLENKDQSQTFAASSPAAYLARTLPSMGLFMPNYYGIGHESLDNYIAMVSGQPPNAVTQADSPAFVNMMPGTVGPDGVAVGQGSVFPSDVKTIADQLASQGLTWRGYMEDMGNSAPAKPATCRHPAIGSPDTDQSAKPTDQYATRHNPFVYFHSIIDTPACDANDVPLDRLPADLGSADRKPNFVFITPDLCADGHDDTCADGTSPGGYKGIDAFLRKWVPQITTSQAYQEGGLLIVTFDEADSDNSACCDEQPGPNTPNPAGPHPGPGGGKTGAVLLSPFIEPGSTTKESYNHYSLLRSVEDIFGLPHLAFAAADGLKPFGSDVYNSAANGSSGGGTGGGGGTTGGPARLRIAVRGVPRRCTSRGFRARVSIRASRGLRAARTYVDHRTVKRTGKTRFSLRVSVRRLRSGKHRLTVMAADRQGKRVRRTVRFKRC